MPRLYLAGFSPRVKFIIITGLTLAPLAGILLLVLLFVYIPIFDAMDAVSAETVKDMVPLHTLQMILHRAERPPHRYLSKGDRHERDDFIRLAAQVDRAFAAVSRSHTRLSGSNLRLNEARAQWKEAKREARNLFSRQVGADLPNAIVALGRFDESVGRTSEALNAYHREIHHHILHEFERSRLLKSRGILLVAFALVLAAVLGIGGSFLLTRDRRSLEASALHDVLTGLYNRRGLEEKLAEAVHRFPGGERRRFALVVFDADRFKEVNDNHGHQTGDAVLHAIGRVVGEHLRESDFVGRLGGDEFMLVLNDVAPQQVLPLADRIRQAIAERPLAHVEGVPVTMTVTMGCASYPDDAAAIDELIAAADEALYIAKRRGRNRVVAFSASRDAEPPRHALLID
jgi:diguanylate cyclase (GGDEF)-like protein